MKDRIPKIIWLLWLQGWRFAPKIAQASLSSWKRLNPNWVVNPLDAQGLSRFISRADLGRIVHIEKEPEALSDQIRIELLYRYGGVWADATTICAKGLDDWLPDLMPKGFFAFSSPGANRMLSTWFLAAEKGNYLIAKWRDHIANYWDGRKFRDSYFWIHNLFREAFESDTIFRNAWESTPKFSANHPFHFGRNAPELFEPPSDYYLEALKSPPVPVFKLTHKLDHSVRPGSLMNMLCDYQSRTNPALANPMQERKKILVGWYGSIPNHGTIGDLRSLEAVVSHLVGRGHQVKHATAATIQLPGSNRINWQEADPNDFDGVVFVCGPILKHHPQTREFFDHFAHNNLAGVGVSLLPREHVNHFNPFKLALARQGGSEDYGDVAIVAPRNIKRVQRRNSFPAIGLALRGSQGEYGTEVCMWRAVNSVLCEIARDLTEKSNGTVINIENHLTKSGLSPEQIEDQYMNCDLVLTSRYHGAITSLVHNTPFIAIDQIVGGAKVYPLLIGLGWPHVYKIDNLPTLKTLMESAKRLLRSDSQTSISHSRNLAISEANQTLLQLDIWAGSLKR